MTDLANLSQALTGKYELTPQEISILTAYRRIARNCSPLGFVLHTFSRIETDEPLSDDVKMALVEKANAAVLAVLKEDDSLDFGE